MSDENGARGDDDVTPDEFAHLFRPDEEGSAPAQGARSFAPEPVAEDDPWEPLIPLPEAVVPHRIADPPLPPPVVEQEVVEAEESDEVVVAIADDAPDSEPAPQSPKQAPEGSRLFRSRGAPERDDAITAVGSMQARRLRTMSRGDEPAPEVDSPNSPPLATPTWNDDDLEPIIAEAVPQPSLDPPLPVASSGEPAPALQVMSRPAPPAAPTQPSASERRRDRERPNIASSGSLTALGVYAVTIGVTVILAFGETLFFGGEPGLITGIGLVAVSIVAAFVVRTRDGLHAIFAPPIAFLVAALTAGQVEVNATDVSNRAVVVFFLLGNNWPWIIGATAAALVIVALRRRVG